MQRSTTLRFGAMVLAIVLLAGLASCGKAKEGGRCQTCRSSSPYAPSGPDGLCDVGLECRLTNQTVYGIHLTICVGYSEPVSACSR